MSCLNSYCQIDSTAVAIQTSTTDSEYTYVKKGIKTSIENALDLKSGYKLKNILSRKVSNYRFEFYSFKRTSTEEVAAILLIAKSNVSGSKYYYCIPVNNIELLYRFYDEISLLDESMTTAICVALAELVFVNVDQ
jgi:hypothetical protein